MSSLAVADGIESSDQHDAPSQNVDIASSYISKDSFIQNPYSGMPSGGGTQVVDSSAFESQNFLQRLFTDGTWNISGDLGYVAQNGMSNYGYGINIFAQTGQLAGFSLGGLLTVMNPVGLGINPSSELDQAQTLPVEKQVTPQELFVEYQYDNIVQADVGWIGINNSPWLTYYQNNVLNVVTYQGALVNVNPGGGWLLTGLAFNGAQLTGENGFSPETLYNYNSLYNAYGYSGLAASPYTAALGATWALPSNDLNLRLWGYQFANYANLAYADSTLQLHASDVTFSIGVQGAMEGDAGGANNVFSSDPEFGSVNSNAFGLQLGVNYDIFSLQGSYNNIWGNSGNSYNGGGLVSPYTYSYAMDPLYTTGWVLGMVELGAGSAYKIAPSLNLLDGDLQIGPSYEYYETNTTSPISEYDLQVTYLLPQIKGLSLFGGVGYLLQSVDSEGAGGNYYNMEFMVSYLY